MSQIIPKEWEFKRLGDISTISAGGTPSTNIDKYWGGNIPWMASGEIHLKRVRQVAKTITELGYKNSSARLFPRQTILVALAGQGKTRGTVAITEIETTTNQSLAGIVTNPQKADPEFIFYNLDRRYDEMRNLSLGGGRGGLNLDILKSLPMLLPPLSHQKRIVSILSTWDSAIDRVSQLIVTKQRLKKSFIQKLLNKPRTKSTQLKDVAEIIFSNVDKKTHVDQCQVSLCNYLDVYNNPYITSKISFMEATASDAEVKKFSLQQGDVVITKDSETPDDIGIPAVVAERLKGVVCGYHLAIIRPDPDKVDSFYLAKALQTLSVRKQLYKYANGATRFGLATGDIGKIEFFVPDINEQRTIGRTFKSLDQEIALLNSKRSLYQQQKKGLMQRLLTGKVRVRV